MGEVNLVTDNDIGRTVAKEAAPGTDAKSGRHRALHRRIRTVGRLEHPNIVPIHDVGVDSRARSSSS